MYQMHNVEALADLHEEYEEPIRRWLDGDLQPDDSEIMIEIIDNTLPEDQILWPPWVMINVNNGHITLTAHVLMIVTQA
jgi:hypothetical protein